MKKIPTVFARDFDDNPRYVTRNVTPGCEWVAAGEGVATRKYDGVCVRLDEHGQWWARREVKPDKTPPPAFEPVAHDEETGKTVGWEPADQSGYGKYLAMAVAESSHEFAPGTFELCGPKVNGNPEQFADHRLIAHNRADRIVDAPRDFDGLAAWMATTEFEGIVFWRDPADPDCDKAKIKRRDFPREA